MIELAGLAIIAFVMSPLVLEVAHFTSTINWTWWAVVLAMVQILHLCFCGRQLPTFPSFDDLFILFRN